MIVDNNQIEWEISLLFKDRLDGIFDGTYTVAYRNNDRRFIIEIPFCNVYDFFAGVR